MAGLHTTRQRLELARSRLKEGPTAYELPNAIAARKAIDFGLDPEAFKHIPRPERTTKVRTKALQLQETLQMSPSKAIAIAKKEARQSRRALNQIRLKAITTIQEAQRLQMAFDKQIVNQQVKVKF